MRGETDENVHDVTGEGSQASCAKFFPGAERWHQLNAAKATFLPSPSAEVGTSLEGICDELDRSTAGTTRVTGHNAES
jgi:hypothetical protein